MGEDGHVARAVDLLTILLDHLAALVPGARKAVDHLADPLPLQPVARAAVEDALVIIAIVGVPNPGLVGVLGVGGVVEAAEQIDVAVTRGVLGLVPRNLTQVEVHGDLLERLARPLVPGHPVRAGQPVHLPGGKLLDEHDLPLELGVEDDAPVGEQAGVLRRGDHRLVAALVLGRLVQGANQLGLVGNEQVVHEHLGHAGLDCDRLGGQGEPRPRQRGQQ